MKTAPTPSGIRAELKGCMVRSSALCFYYNLIDIAGKKRSIRFDVEKGLSIKAAHDQAAEIIRTLAR